MTVREQTQLQEAQYLSSRAVLSQRTKGRERPEEEDPIRTPGNGCADLLSAGYGSDCPQQGIPPTDA